VVRASALQKTKHIMHHLYQGLVEIAVPRSVARQQFWLKLRGFEKYEFRSTLDLDFQILEQCSGAVSIGVTRADGCVSLFAVMSIEIIIT
jgi:hypothetical protein